MTSNKPSVEKSLDAEILTLMLSNPSITKDVDSKLMEKVKNNTSAFLAITAFVATAIFSPGVASAMDNTLKGTLLASGLAGVVTNNNRPSNIPRDCNVKGTNGWMVGGSGALGAVVGNQVGGGSGKKIATVLGGLLGGGAAAMSENRRIEDECVRQAVNAPQRNLNGQMPQDSIYYQGVRVSTGQPYYVTARNSMGIAGLYGQAQANIDINMADPMIKNAMDETSRNLENSFRNLDILSQSFGQKIYGNVESRYNVNYNSEESRYQQSQNQIRLEYLKQDFDRSFVKYAEDRAKFVHMADNAAMDGVNITQYQNYLNYIEPPVSTKMMYNGNMPNKYAVLPNARVR